MTSASELFYTRRSRVGRAGSDLGGIDSFSPERTFHHRRHHHNHHNHRHDFDGCDPLRRSPHPRRPSHPERASGRLDQGTSQFVLSNNPSNTEVSSSTSEPPPPLNGNQRLPGAVLLARARLLERLRGVSLSANRRSVRASSGIHLRGNIFGDELRLVDAGDWETEGSAERLVGGSPFSDQAWSPRGRLPLLVEGKKTKPPGLTQEALDCLQLEVFSSLKVGVEGEASQASLDCSICLESFMDGDELIRLPCQHRFHSVCLDPWIRSCGDCPYCRRDIAVSSHRPIKST